MLPYIRSIHVGDIYRTMFQIFREDVQLKRNDGVATILDTGQCIVVYALIFQETRLVEFRQTETYRVSVAECVYNRRVEDRQHVDIDGADTVVAVLCLRVVRIGIALCYIIAVLPCVRRLVMTDGNGVFLYHVGVVEVQAEAVNRVASVPARH